MTARRPHSVVKRIAWLVVGISVVTVVVHGAMLVSGIQPLVEQVARQASVTVRIAQGALSAAQAPERDAVVERMRQAGVDARRIASGTDASPTAPSNVPFSDPLMRRLARYAEPGIEALPPRLDERQGIALRFVAAIDGEPWQIELPAIPRPAANPLLPLFTALGLTGIAAALASILGARSITRPLSRLSQAVLDRRAALAPISEPPGSGIEVNGVVSAFNALVHALQSAEASQRNMLAGLSHDLRTPLARLRLRAELECDESVQARMNVDFDALSRIIDQFLVYSQGRTATPDDGTLASPLSIARRIAESYRDGGVDVRLEASADPPGPMPVLPDLALRRIIDNLVDNARTHGRAPIEIAVRRRPGVLGIVVHDHGRGFAPEALAEATAPFTRLGHSQRGVGHCGLGLAIVAQIAERLGGKVIVLPWDGSRFGIGVELPTDRAADIEV